MVGGGVDDLLDAVHVRGEGGDDDLARGLAEHLVEDRADLTLRRDESGHQRVRGVHHEQVDALLAHAGEGAQVGEATVQRQLIHLEVARNEDVARIGTREDRERVGDRVGDRDELEVEGSDGEAVALGDDVEARVGQAVFAQLGGDEGQGQVGAVDRNVAAQLEQVGHRANVVLVAVGEDEADDVVHAILDPGEIRQDQVDAGLGLLREENATIHDQELAPVLEDVHVTADLAETSQRDHSQCALFQGRGFAEVLVQRLHDASLPRWRCFARIGRHVGQVAPLTFGVFGGAEPLVLAQVSVFHGVAAVGKAAGLGLVGDNKDGGPPIGGVAQEGQDGGRVRVIEASGRLVREDDGGVHEKGARDRHAPQFAARQLGGCSIGEVTQTHGGQQLAGTIRGCLGLVVEDRGEQDVVKDRQGT